MSGSDCEVDQVIVVVEAPPTDANVQKSMKRSETTQRRNNPGLEKKRKLVTWEVLDKVHSTAAFQNWLKQKEAAGVKYTRKKTATTWQGAKDYYGCTGPGCPVQLEVLFDSSCEDVVISYNGTQHKHGEKPHSGWGVPEKTKKEVQRLFQAGVTTTTEIDARLRKLGHANYTLKQLKGYVGRVRRLSHHQEVVQEYSSLSVWSGPDRSSSQECRLAAEEDSSCYSPPPPAEEAEFSDPSPPASPRRPAAASSRSCGLGLGPSPGRHRRHQTAMDEGAVRRLVDASLAARGHSYSPYSRFPVGAALLCSDGQIVTGCNVENASFGLTNCAERTAVFKAVSEGRTQFAAVAIAAEMGDKFVGPCGACRQVLAEFNAEMPVILAKPNGQITRTNMKDLLPMAFLPGEVTFKKE